jgi:predicted Rossmann fold flavoprotein
MKVTVIGGGAAGLSAAYAARLNGHSVTIIEKNSRMARKVLITGKGRCNLTNSCDMSTLIDNIPRNGRFLYSAFSRYSPQDIMALFEAAGVPLKTERGNRVFPQSDRAVDIVDALAAMGTKGCRVIHGDADALIADGQAVVGVRLADGRVIESDHTVVATGGCSYPLTGSTGDGYRLAQSVGHTVTPIRPSLIPIDSSDAWVVDLAGLSLKNVAINITKGGNTIYTDFGEMLFTHTGVSGPMILSASAHIDSCEGCTLHIDLKPALTADELEARLMREFERQLNRDFKNSLSELLPRSMIEVFIARSGISPDKKVNQITKAERQVLVALLKDFAVTLSHFRPIEEAIITRGGVSVKELDPKTMRSKLLDGLSFAGEVIDVDAYTGGFNLQIAFATGLVAGDSI